MNTKTEQNETASGNAPKIYHYWKNRFGGWDIGYGNLCRPEASARTEETAKLIITALNSLPPTLEQIALPTEVGDRPPMLTLQQEIQESAQ